jgi:hypothetical protein
VRAEIGSYPFTTIDRNVGVVQVPDTRLARVAEVVGSPQIVPATIEFVDIAGLVRGAHRGEGLGNQFLGHIREMDALVHVVRCFESENVAHVDGAVDPVRDIETINLELILADVAAVDKRLQRLERPVKSGEREYVEEYELLVELRRYLDGGELARALELGEDAAHLEELNLLTLKPTIYAANLGEGDFRELAGRLTTGQPTSVEPNDAAQLAASANPVLKSLAAYVEETGETLVVFSAKLEAELAELDHELRSEFLAEMELEEPALYRIIRGGYNTLDLITFFTANENEARAWTATRGTKAPQAAGKVHTDMQQGFIRAEVIQAELLDEVGSLEVARERGLIRVEGRDYTVADGDVLYFRFST